MDATVAECVAITISMPSLLLYLFECFVIIRHWKESFNSSFFKLFLVSAFNNLIFSFVGSFFFVRLMTLPFLANFFLAIPGWLSTIFFALQLYNVHFDNLITIAILFQRLTIILLPFDNEKIWKYIFPPVVLVIFIVPLILCSHLFGISIPYAVLGDGSIHFQQIHHNPANPSPNNSFILAVSCLITLAICLCLNAAILWALKKQTKAMGEQAVAGREIEFRLMVYSILIFGAQSVVCIFQILMYATTNFDDVRIHVMNQFVWVNDLRSMWTPTWFLLWASSDVRQKIRELIWKSKNGEKESKNWKTPVEKY